MPQIISNPSMGASIGQALGTGLGQGLQMLAQHKLTQMIGQREAQKNSQFWRSAGLPEGMAQAFGSAPVEIQKALLDRLEGLGFGVAPEAQPQGIALESLGQLQQEQPAQYEGEAQPGQPLQHMLSFLSTPQLQQQRTTPSRSMLAQQPTAQQATAELPTQAPEVKQAAQPALILGPNSAERRHREVLAQQRELAQYKATKDVRHDIVEKAKAARQDLKDLDRMEELGRDNRLSTPGYVEFLKRSGLDIPTLTNPSTEEFLKIQANFLRNAKAYFGSRISNYEAEQFLKTIPSLSQSPEGRKRVIANLKYISRAALEHYNALKEVIAENKGLPPMDLEEQIYDKTEKKMDALAKKFREDLAKPVPKGQNKLITALQAGAGSLASVPGQLLHGAGNVLAGAAGGKAAAALL